MKKTSFFHFVAAIVLVFCSNGCKESNEKMPTQINETTKKEVIAFLESFAKIRTAIPPNPKAYLSLFANDERFFWGSDYGFETNYQAFIDKRDNDPDYAQKLNPDWVTRFDFVFRDYKISPIDAKTVLISAYYDEFVVARLGDTLQLKNNVMHGSLVKINGEWKILTMIFAHSGENEKLDAEFDARNSKAFFKPFTMSKTDKGKWVIMDSQKTPMYDVFIYDNGPDYAAEGLIRVVKNGKIGYADAKTYTIVIPPQFDCAFPFENGKAKVSNQCKTVKDGEHSVWESETWQYVDKMGKF